MVEIARIEGLTPQCVSITPSAAIRIIQAAGHHPPRDPAFIASVQGCLRAQGLSMSQIGDRLGVSKNVIVGIYTRHLKAAQSGQQQEAS